MRPPVAAAQQAIYGSSPSGPPKGRAALDLMAAANAADPWSMCEARVVWAGAAGVDRGSWACIGTLTTIF